MNTTINISLPKRMYSDAKDLVKKENFTSISELIRHALRNVLYPNGLTVNGFTPEFEDMVLEAEKEPIKGSEVWETEEDIDKYFARLENSIKRAKNNKNGSIRKKSLPPHSHRSGSVALSKL